MKKQVLSPTGAIESESQFTQPSDADCSSSLPNPRSPATRVERSPFLNFPSSTRRLARVGQTQKIRSNPKYHVPVHHPWRRPLEADISIWRKRGHFYFALTRVKSLRSSTAPVPEADRSEICRKKVSNIAQLDKSIQIANIVRRLVVTDVHQRTTGNVWCPHGNRSNAFVPK